MVDRSTKLEDRNISFTPVNSGNLRVPVLLIDRSESICSVFCGFNEVDESNSFDDGSASSSSFRLFALLFDGPDDLELYRSEYGFIGES